MNGIETRLGILQLFLELNILGFEAIKFISGELS